MEYNIVKDAQIEATRLLSELKSLNAPNHPDGKQYIAKVSVDFIKKSGSRYDKLLFDTFGTPVIMTFGGIPSVGYNYISMSRNALKKILHGI